MISSALSLGSAVCAVRMNPEKRLFDEGSDGRPVQMLMSAAAAAASVVSGLSLVTSMGVLAWVVPGAAPALPVLVVQLLQDRKVTGEQRGRQ